MTPPTHSPADTRLDASLPDAGGGTERAVAFIFPFCTIFCSISFCTVCVFTSIQYFVFFVKLFTDVAAFSEIIGDDIMCRKKKRSFREKRIILGYKILKKNFKG